MREKLQKFYLSVWPESRTERFFLLAAVFCGFLISADYSIVRPVSNSVLLSFFPSTILPYLWLGAIPLNFFLVTLYNRYLPKLGCLKIFLFLAVFIGVGNLMGMILLKQSPYFSIFHFIWKEIYVLLLFQTLWSLIHMTVSGERAKSIYGLMFGIGGLGSVCGSFIPGCFAFEMGSENLLFFSVLILVALSFCYRFAIKCSVPLSAHATFSKGGGEVSSLRKVMQMITGSHVLPYILLFVVLMQLCSTLLDYQFSAYLQQAYPEKNLRTEFLGKMGSMISSLTILLQFIGTFVFLNMLGLRGTHLFIPLLLGCNVVFSLIWPGLRMLAISFATIKVLDFSVFGVVKEMLYLKLSPEEKFQAKAFIDVFAYRGAKAIAALTILMLQFFCFDQLHTLGIVSLSLLCLWGYGLVRLFRGSKDLLRI